MKYFEKKKLVNYIKQLEQPKVPYPQGYIDNHKTEIEMLKWIIGYYEGRTASKPMKYLEALLDKSENYQDYVNEMNNCNIIPMNEVDRLKMKLKEISVLYIIGFIIKKSQDFNCETNQVNEMYFEIFNKKENG